MRFLWLIMVGALMVSNPIESFLFVWGFIVCALAVEWVLGGNRQ